MRWLLPILILLTGVGGFMALKASKPEATALEAREKIWLVSTQSVDVVDQAPVITLYGRVESPQIAELSAALIADVTQVLAFEGQSVTRDQVLVSLDDREARLVLEQREAEADEIRAQIETENDRHRNNRNALLRERELVALSRMALSRAEDLAATNVGSQSQIDTARQDEARQLLALETRESLIRQHDSVISAYEAKLARAQALVERARLDLSRTEVRAPFDGRISKMFVAPGDRITVGTPLVNIIDTSRIEIRAQIPTRQLAKVRESLATRERLSASSEVDGRLIRSQLDRLTGEIELGSGGVDGLFVVSDGGNWLQLGRIVELELELPIERGTVVVPFEAIYGNNRLYKFVDGRMHGIEIENLGEIRYDDGQSLALVRSDAIESGDEVVITQLPNAIEGLRVRVAGATRQPDS